ncbi:hypothetical protein BLA13014_00529 [Burkholderia aenigmatica]|uniref:DUF4145 domain-containing protein n=2 Tax=Burkholderia aenigmatica TaxID=2015348 RepID=A0A6P2HID2_9BURK|nr:MULTISPECIES: DUF4145 domain-containing protein [unclassified Burkholderia]VWB17454.1 hypothetical protein BLA13014_00529 [Burkholderia aenigmatica]
MGEYGQIYRPVDDYSSQVYRLVRCSNCGSGALATFLSHQNEPAMELLDFYPEADEMQQPLPKDVPEGIAREFREGESCANAGCYRAAAAMFRSVLDKALRASGYKIKKGTPLDQQIDLAAADGVITAARKKRAHEEIRTLGNYVLHEPWRVVSQNEVNTAREYAARLLHDLYDDRETVLSVLKEKGRIPEETIPDIDSDDEEAPA